MSALAINGGDPLRGRPYPDWPQAGERERELLEQVLASGNWDSRYGPFVRRFEKEFAAYQGARYAICVVNGEAALRVPLQELGMEPGDEVIVPAYTFMATATAVLQAGGSPVFADVEAGGLGLDPAAVEALLGPRTVAIVPVHIGGMPAAMSAIVRIAQRHSLAVIEDAAQAWGARTNGRAVGAIGRAGAFSFHASKNLTCGEGGAIVTDDDELAASYRSLANNGRGASGERYRHVRLGSNLRLSEFHGALLCAALERYPEELQRRDRNALSLRAALERVAGVRCQAMASEVENSSWHLVVMQLERTAFGGASKAAIVAALAAEGIPATGGYDRPAYAQPLFQGSAVPHRVGDCPVAESACASEAIWVRQNVLLGDEEDAIDVARALERVQRHCGDLGESSGDLGQVAQN